MGSALAIKMDKRVQLQRRDAGQDEYGQEAGAGWIDVIEVWAAVEDLTGRQYVAAQAAQNSVQTKITIRHREGVVPAMRAVWNGTSYDIEAVLGTNGRTLELMCVRGLSGG